MAGGVPGWRGRFPAQQVGGEGSGAGHGGGAFREAEAATQFCTGACTWRGDSGPPWRGTAGPWGREQRAGQRDRPPPPAHGGQDGYDPRLAALPVMRRLSPNGPRTGSGQASGDPQAAAIARSAPPRRGRPARAHGPDRGRPLRSGRTPDPGDRRGAPGRTFRAAHQGDGGVGRVTAAVEVAVKVRTAERA